MKLPGLAILTAVLLFSAGLCVHAQTGDAKKIAEASVSGRITIKGKPAAGVPVGLRLSQSQSSDSALKAFTDQDGRYRIANVPAGTYQIAPVAPAWVISDVNKAWGQSLVINEGEKVAGIDFDLLRGGVITGKVTDSNGLPIAEEMIFLLAGDNTRGGFSRVPGFSQTDDRGIYRVFGIRPGRYKVSIGEESLSAWRGFGTGRAIPITFYPNVADAAKATLVEVGEGTEATNIDITLAPAARTFSVSGRVVDGETGKPVTNVPIQLMKIMIIDANSSSASGGGTNVRSNADGEFTLEKLPAGKYSISIQPPPESNLRAESITFDLVDREVTGLLIKTASGASLSGTVVLEQTRDRIKAGPAPAWLSVYLRNDSLGYSSNQSTDIKPDGSFQIGGLTAGTVGFSVGAWSPTGDAKPIPILRVERDGVVQPNGIQLQGTERISGIRVVATYAGGSIRGVVKLENGVLPPGGHLHISLSRVGDASPRGGGTATDARGRFLIEGLVSGTYELTVMAFLPDSRPGMRTVKQIVTVTEGAPTDVVVSIDLAPAKNP